MMKNARLLSVLSAAVFVFFLFSPAAALAWGKDSKAEEDALKKTREWINRAQSDAHRCHDAFAQCRKAVEQMKESHKKLTKFTEEYNEAEYKEILSDAGPVLLSDEYESNRRKFHASWESFVKNANGAWNALLKPDTIADYYRKPLDEYKNFIGYPDKIDPNITREQGVKGKEINRLTKEYQELIWELDPDRTKQLENLNTLIETIELLRNRQNAARRTCRVRYCTRDGAEVMEAKEFRRNEKLGYPEPEHTTGRNVSEGKVRLIGNGWKFRHWSLRPDGEKYEANTREITDDVTLYMVLDEVPVLVSFLNDDGTAYTAPAELFRKGSPELVKPPFFPEKWGYECIGWRRDGEKELFDGFGRKLDAVLPWDTKNADLNLRFYPVWKEVGFRVRYLNAGNGATKEITERELTLSGEMPDVKVPPRPGYEAVGWVREGREEPVEPGTPFAEVIENREEGVDLYAKRRPVSYTVTFLSRTAESPEPAELTGLRASGSAEQAVQRPRQPVLDGYEFDDWYADGAETPFEFGKPLLADTALVARWKPIPRRITLHDAGRENVNCVSSKGYWSAETLLPEPPSPPGRRDYDFAGWTLRAGDNLLEVGEKPPEKFTFGRPVLKDLDLYAVWQRRSVEVTVISPTLLTNLKIRFPQGEAVKDRLPPVPPLMGRTVVSWQKLDSASGKRTGYDISAPVVEDITLYPVFDVAGGGSSVQAPGPSDPKPVRKPTLPTLTVPEKQAPVRRPTLPTSRP